MDKIIELSNKYKQFIIYSIIGVTGASLDFIIYALLTEKLEIDNVLANVISTTFGIIDTFVLNLLFDFKVKDNLGKRFVTYYLVGLSGLLLSSAIIYIFVDLLEFNNLVVKLVSIIFVVMLQYNFNKRVSFKKINPNQEV